MSVLTRDEIPSAVLANLDNCAPQPEGSFACARFVGPVDEVWWGFPDGTYWRDVPPVPPASWLLAAVRPPPIERFAEDFTLITEWSDDE